MPDSAAKGIELAGRIFLALIFLLSGFNKIADWEGTSQYMEAQGMVAVPLFLLGAIVVEVGGALSLIFGLWTRIGAAVLLIFLVPVTAIFHDFWALEGEERVNQMTHFMKNLAIWGGLLIVLARGAGPISVDSRRSPTGPA